MTYARAAGVSVHRTVCRAIDAKQLVAFTYEGSERVVEPHLCGHNKAGHDVLLAWFVRGHSDSGSSPGWRTYLVTEIHAMHPLEERFPSARPGYNPADGSMRLVYCRLDRL